ncbi:hypothetical protein FNV43_RR07371 [Rhamnella rubrinervis]|uniref:Uncharacterized protein n=1 Tax=Rhamnella rubrinervis TaxID=2594499 RepID=A0A8K0HEN0_9ROSA|nr:hypothetical protein FNV43_RR07371 [Rhamnella rubrinervis]
MHSASLEAGMRFPMPAVIRLPTVGSKFRAPWGLVKFEWPTIPTVGEEVARKVISLKAKTVEKATKLAIKVHLMDPSIVDAIKNIKVGKRPASEPTIGGNTSKSRRMARSFSKSTTSSKSTNSIGVGAGQTPTSRSFTIKENERLAVVTKAEVAENGLSQIDKKYQGAKTSLKNKEKEVEGLKETIQELTIELDEFKKEGSENVMLGYSIMRRAVVRKLPDYNMIKLDQLATEEA